MYTPHTNKNLMEHSTWLVLKCIHWKQKKVNYFTDRNTKIYVFLNFYSQLGDCSRVASTRERKILKNKIETKNY